MMATERGTVTVYRALDFLVEHGSYTRSILECLRRMRAGGRSPYQPVPDLQLQQVGELDDPEIAVLIEKRLPYWASKSAIRLLKSLDCAEIA